MICLANGAASGGLHKECTPPLVHDIAPRRIRFAPNVGWPFATLECAARQRPDGTLSPKQWGIGRRLTNRLPLFTELTVPSRPPGGASG